MNELELPPASERKVSAGAGAASHSANTNGSEHLVQFYENDAFLENRVSEFMGTGLEAGEVGVLIATFEHRAAIERELQQRGLNLAALTKQGQYFSFDAKETLSQFRSKDSVDETRFKRVVGGVVAKAAGSGRRVRAFGEMVAILVAEKSQDAAIQLEEMWNELSRKHSLSLLCAYPMQQFCGTAKSEAFRHICDTHGIVLPTENSTMANRSDPERSRAMALLEQKANSLQTEIAKCKQMEERGRLLASIVEFSDDAIISKDLNGIITSWNNGAQRIFGYEAEEIVGHSVLELIPPDRQHEEPKILSKLRAGQRIDHYETVRRRKDGSDIEVSLTVSPVKDDSGIIIGASKIARDISERKRAEMIQQVLYELASTVNSAVALPEIYDAAINAVCRCQHAQRAAVLLYDAEGVMRFRAWRNLSDKYREAVEGHSPWKRDDLSPQPICLDDVRKVSMDEHVRAVVNGEGIRSLAFLPITYEGRLLGKFMVYYNVPHHFTPEELRPAQTIVTQVAFAIERRRTGENLERMVNERTASLREAIAQMEEFSYSVSHDLRAPVRAMQCYAEVLMEDYGAGLDDHAKKYLDRIIQGGARMDRLIQDILTYSRLSRREIKLQPISLDKLTRDIAAQYLDTRGSTAPEILVDGTLPSVVAHEASLSQAISNLLNNAVKFVAPGMKPKVNVRAEQRNGDIRLWVEDNGIGIKPEYQHRLFSMFERVHPEKNYEGTGIGLAIVRKAAERMGGKAGLESDGVSGCRFWIQLPAAQKP
jgi:PAS domain S-box-containing protein